MIDLYRRHYHQFAGVMDFVGQAKALKALVIFLVADGEFEEAHAEIEEKTSNLEKVTELMDFDELEKVTKILVYVRRRLSTIGTRPTYGAGLSRDPTPSELESLRQIQNAFPNSMGGMGSGRAKEFDGFINDLRGSDLDDE